MKVFCPILLLFASKAVAQKQVEPYPDPAMDQSAITLQTLEKEKEALQKKLAQATADGIQATATNCYEGTIKSGFTTMTEDDIMEALWPQVFAAVSDYTKRNEVFEDLFERSGTCQLKCFEDMIGFAYRSLFGKLGPDYLSRDGTIMRLFQKATAGAFAACYPNTRAGGAIKHNGILSKELSLANSIVDITKNPGAPAFKDPEYKFPKGLACMNAGKEDQFPISEFMVGFENELNNLMTEDVYFAKSCQKQCLSKAVESSIMTLFRTNRGSDDVLEHAVSGAVRACVPEVGQDSVNSLIENAKIQLVTVQKKAASGAQVCYGGSIEVNGAMVSKKKFLKDVMEKMNGAIIAVSNDDADLKSYMSNNGTCQADCLKDMMPPTLETLFGKLGVHFPDDGEEIRAIFDKSLGGAFKACYPCASEASMKKVARAIVGSFSKEATADSDKDLPSSGNCTHSDFTSKFDKDAFMANFTTTRKLKVAEDLEMSDYFKLKAKACQVPCLDDTVPLAVGTLMQSTWTADRPDWKDVYSTAISSAIRACFPEIPQKHIDALTKDTMKFVVPPAEEPKKEKKCKKKPSGNSTGNASAGNSSDSDDLPLCEDDDSGGNSTNSSAAPAAPAVPAVPPARLYNAGVNNGGVKASVSWINNFTFIGLIVGATLTLASVVSMVRRRSSSDSHTFRAFQQLSTRTIEATPLETIEADEEGLIRTSHL